jgi:hypothetical protein
MVKRIVTVTMALVLFSHIYGCQWKYLVKINRPSPYNKAQNEKDLAIIDQTKPTSCKYTLTQEEIGTFEQPADSNGLPVTQDIPYYAAIVGIGNIRFAIDSNGVSYYNITIIQEADTETADETEQSRGDNTADVAQNTDGFNALDVLQDGAKNSATVSQTDPVAATQYGYNNAGIDQIGKGNIISVTQDPPNDNTLYTYQNGEYSFAELNQIAFTSNTAYIIQDDGLNQLYGAAYCGRHDPYNPATQISLNGSNSFILIQTGICNVVGLYQNAFGSNMADINQVGDFNTFSAYQHSTNGCNLLKVDQSSSDTARICQVGPDNNIANVHQRDN